MWNPFHVLVIESSALAFLERQSTTKVDSLYLALNISLQLEKHLEMVSNISHSAANPCN
uniref:Uncharacterized protein n=1 Tax=Anopheles minimus TaxID=112268 RepID=A0A182WMY1_9DIPT